MPSSRVKTAALLVASLLIGDAALANPMVGGAKMYPNKNIVDNAVHSKVHTTLVAAVKAAGLVDTLEGAGPFTVFAPVNSAFSRLPPGQVETLLKPENKDQLSKILTYHVVAGKLTAAGLREDAESHGGVATLTTVEGEKLEVRPEGKRLELIDSKGDKAMITTADVMQSNGVIHVIDHVLLP
jgi:uncharacterized surface protein with fasciclin (FAS1) repeats